MVNNLEPADRDIAMVFQNYALYPHMSVFDNMAYGLKIRGLPSRGDRQRVDKAADILELAPLLKRTPRQLSGGQRQRVAMGRAIVREPAVFLFDEPLSNLDAKLRVQMRLEIQKLHRELGITTLYVTHDQVEAMTLAQRMIVHERRARGADRHAERGIPASRPPTFVAGFIGCPPMNLMRGKADGTSFTVGGQRLPLPQAAPRNGELILGMRPEHALWDEGGAGTWELQVDVGRDARRRAAGLLPPGRNDVHRAHRRHAAAAQARRTVPLRAPAERLHWFDPTSGKRGWR